MLFRVLKTTLNVALLFGAMTFNAAARDYNEGFLAAEGGDFKSAVEQWGPLAEQGHAIAQFNMALLYHSGLGVDLDEAKAVSWYKKSATNGYRKAQEYLAVGYREGWFGLPKDSKQASYWEKQLEENVR
ncbi:tetratricopeptide repeat protein [Kaarinaea lacus]